MADLEKKIKELEKEIEHLKATRVCDACKGDGKKRWLSIGGSLNVANCFKCGGEGRVKIR